jgi:hypothetical protein
MFSLRVVVTAEKHPLSQCGLGNNVGAVTISELICNTVVPVWLRIGQ